MKMSQTAQTTACMELNRVCILYDRVCILIPAITVRIC